MCPKDWNSSENVYERFYVGLTGMNLVLKWFYVECMAP